MPRQDDDDDEGDDEQDMRHQITNATAAVPSEKGGLETQGSDDGVQPIDTPGQHVRPPEGVSYSLCAKGQQSPFF
jgi:hypothetical protein